MTKLAHRVMCWVFGHIGGTQERVTICKDGADCHYFECDRCGRHSEWPL